jgi:hypothetical protein
MNSEEGIKEIWSDDLLGRMEDAVFLKKFLLNRLEEKAAAGAVQSYVLNLDAGWGHGKTFFLQRFAKTLEAEKYLVANVNAWVDDHADDPLLAVLSAIDRVVSPLIGKKEKAKRTWASIKKTGEAVALATIKGVATHAASKVLGESVNSVLQELNADGEDVSDAAQATVKKVLDEKAQGLLDRFRDDKDSIENFREGLQSFLKELKSERRRPPLFVLVDELDRCRPSYAVHLLERVKHLFSINNVIFVFATDLEQLHHAIKAVYGIGFDSKRYLYRFFDRTYVFEKPSLKSFCETLVEKAALKPEKFSIPSNVSIGLALAGGFSFFGLSLRDAEQTFDIIRSVYTVWDSSRLPIELIVLLPLAVAQQQGLHPIELTGEFSKQLKEFAKGRGLPSAWRFPFNFYRQERGTVTEYVGGMGLFDIFLGEIGKMLPDIGGDASNNPHYSWVYNRFGWEFSTLHNNSYPSGSKPSSILRKYPKFVRSAGRLKPV